MAHKTLPQRSFARDRLICVDNSVGTVWTDNLALISTSILCSKRMFQHRCRGQIT